ncbi:Zinc finger MYND domain-containing protein [Schistosoma japonicum]|uniref:Zinc finger MYND domain-containing protein n=1 Tax=Schistosoma japonicum TaxID=6182 RepID=A0A4Z2DUL2_SCHJA|nr:Zinc finger MYND domain-containing protein [Schistosoma japonicum]
MSVRRYTDPVYLQFVWNAIEACSRDSIESTFHELLSFIQRECDSKCTAAKLQSELSNAISDGCIECNQRCYLKRDPMPKGKDKHDWYCFECHGPGHVVSCPTCFRVYHPDCLPAALSSQLSSVIPCEAVGSDVDSNMSNGLPPTNPCPVCQRLSRASNVSNPICSSELYKIFQVVLDRIRNKVNWKTMQVVGYLNEPLRNHYLVFRQINTRLMTERMRADPSSKDCYPNRTCLLIDADLLIHNTAIFYGSKNDMSNMARQIRSQLERELRESSFCIDCYLRLHSSSVNKLTAPCRVPHRLLWFQHNGWSFRPCKMLYENAEGYEVICFGGRHERVFVPLARAFDMNFTAGELGLRETPPLKKALNEAEEYKTNQAIFDRQMKNYSDQFPNNKLTESISFCLMRNDQVNESISNGAFLKNSTPPPLRKKRPGRRPLSTRCHNESFNTAPEMQGLKSRKPTTTNSPSCCPTSLHSMSKRGPHWSDTLKNVTEDNLTSLSSLNSDSDDPKTKCRISGPISENLSLNKSSMKLSIPLISTATKRKSHKRKRCDDLHSRASFSNGMSAVTPSCDSSSSELSTASFTAKTQRTIRIKPLPLRNENNDIPLSMKKIDPSLSRLTSVNSHVCAEPLHSMSSSSSAASGPSSDRTTVPALASSCGHTPPDSSAFSTSSTYSEFSKKSRGRPPKTYKSVKPSLPSASVKSVTETSDECSSTRLMLSARNTYESTVKNKHTVFTVPINSIHSDRLSGPDEDKQLPVCSLSPPSSLSDAESDLSSLSSSSSTVSSSSQLSSSSLSSTSTLSSPALRLSFSTLKSRMNDEPSTARQKQKSSKDMLAPLQSQLTLETRDSNEGAKETDNSQHVQKLTKPTKSSRHNLETKTHIRPSSRSNVSSTFKSADINNDFQDEDIRFCVISPEKSIKPEKLSGIPRISGDGNNSVDNKSLSSAAPNSSLKSFAFDSPNTKLSSKAAHPTGWSNGTKILSTFNDQPSAAPQLAHPTGTNVPTGPTPPSNSSASSSCYSSVSPAALSSTSGLGSSLSDPKSVDASPGEVATMLGSAPFSCSSGNGNGPVPHLQSDSNMIKTEERIHRIYADRLIALTTERDQAREEVHRRDILISELRRAHEAEIKRVKQRTWCQVCLNEAFYHCCPGTAYCSETCQFEHWTAQHNRDCRRRTESQQQQQLQS